MTRPDIEEISKRYESRDGGRGGYGLWTDSITIHWPAIREYIAELERDAAAYQFIRAEHDRVDPVCGLSWKMFNIRNSANWGSVPSGNELDGLVSAAIAATKEKP